MFSEQMLWNIIKETIKRYGRFKNCFTHPLFDTVLPYYTHL